MASWEGPKLLPSSAPFHSDEIDAYFHKGDIILFKENRKDLDPEFFVGVIREPFASNDLWSLEMTLVTLLQKNDSSSTVEVITNDITTKRSSHITKVV